MLDARGEAVIYLDPSLSYDFVLKDAADNAVWTRDGIAPGVDRNDLASTSTGKGSTLVSFIQAGTGTRARTMLDKSRERVSLADFAGVDPTGAADSTVAYNAAMASGAKEVEIGPGTYVVSSHLTVTPGVRVIGKGKPIIKMADNLATKPDTLLNLNFAGSFSDVTFEGIIFDSNRANNIDHGTPNAQGN